MHMDHCGGLLADGVKERLRPDLRVHLAAAEAEFWEVARFLPEFLAHAWRLATAMCSLVRPRDILYWRYAWILTKCRASGPRTPEQSKWPFSQRVMQVLAAKAASQAKLVCFSSQRASSPTEARRMRWRAFVARSCSSARFVVMLDRR